MTDDANCIQHWSAVVQHVTKYWVHVYQCCTGHRPVYMWFVPGVFLGMWNSVGRTFCLLWGWWWILELTVFRALWYGISTEMPVVALWEVLLFLEHIVLHGLQASAATCSQDDLSFAHALHHLSLHHLSVSARRTSFHSSIHPSFGMLPGGPQHFIFGLPFPALEMSPELCNW